MDEYGPVIIIAESSEEDEEEEPQQQAAIENVEIVSTRLATEEDKESIVQVESRTLCTPAHAAEEEDMSLAPTLTPVEGANIQLPLLTAANVKREPCPAQRLELLSELLGHLQARELGTCTISKEYLWGLHTKLSEFETDALDPDMVELAGQIHSIEETPGPTVVTQPSGSFMAQDAEASVPNPGNHISASTTMARDTSFEQELQALLPSSKANARSSWFSLAMCNRRSRTAQKHPTCDESEQVSEPASKRPRMQ